MFLCWKCVYQSDTHDNHTCKEVDEVFKWCKDNALPQLEEVLRTSSVNKKESGNIELLHLLKEHIDVGNKVEAINTLKAFKFCAPPSQASGTGLRMGQKQLSSS